MTATDASTGTGTGREVAFLHDGGFYHLATLDDLAAAGVRVRPVYLPDLVTELAAGLDPLAGVDRLFVADRLHPRLWAEVADRCVDVARRGGVVFVSGVNAVDAVPGVTARATDTNFWWWRTGEDPGIHVHDTAEPLQEELNVRAQRWHHHHVLATPGHATVLVSHTAPDDPDLSGALLTVDRHSTAGVVAVAGMDPVYHHGSRFMPGATELLYGVLRWLARPTP